MMEFEHRQTADDDEGMDLCKKKSLLQSATCIEGGGPPGSHHRFFCSQFLIITLQGSAILSLQQQRYY